jgi:hypothetical protein
VFVWRQSYVILAHPDVVPKKHQLRKPCVIETVCNSLFDYIVGRGSRAEVGSKSRQCGAVCVVASVKALAGHKTLVMHPCVVLLVGVSVCRFVSRCLAMREVYRKAQRRKSVVFVVDSSIPRYDS